MAAANDRTLQTILDIIVRTVSPVQVILFGSQARGDAAKGSDYDIIVVKDGVVNEREVSRKVHRALFDAGVRAPVDVIVVDSARYARRRTEPGTVYHWGAAEGEVVYG